MLIEHTQFSNLPMEHVQNNLLGNTHIHKSITKTEIHVPQCKQNQRTKN